MTACRLSRSTSLAPAARAVAISPKATVSRPTPTSMRTVGTMASTSPRTTARRSILRPQDTVLATGNQDNYCYHLGFGKYVAIEDATKGLVLWYAHLGTIAVSPGTKISKGAEIGTVGATGYELGVHLHFSVFDSNGFSMQKRNGCGPDPTGQDIDPVPFPNQYEYLFHWYRWHRYERARKIISGEGMECRGIRYCSEHTHFCAPERRYPCDDRP